MRNWERWAFLTVLILQGLILLWKISPSATKESLNPDRLSHLSRPIHTNSSSGSSKSCLPSPIFIELEKPYLEQPTKKSSSVEIPPKVGKFSSQTSIALTMPFVVSQLPQLREFVASWISFPPCLASSSPDGFRFEFFLYYSRTIEQENTTVQAEIAVSYFIA